jgi:hypothetical protein
MNDEAKTDAPAPPEEPKQIEGPKLAYVKGGTGTTASENLYERRHQEAEARRAEADIMRRESKDQVEERLPGRDGGELRMKQPGHEGGAVQYTSQMTAHPEVPKAYVCLTYLTRTGAKMLGPQGDPVQCCADIIVGANPELPTELCLVLVCPKCQADSHKHQQDNQLRIFQSNKYFELVTGKGPATFLWVDKDDRGRVVSRHMYRSAGMIVESEPFDCPDCGWRARIDNNHVRPD